MLFGPKIVQELPTLFYKFCINSSVLSTLFFYGTNLHWLNCVCARGCRVHILRQPPEGGGGGKPMLTIADEVGRGGLKTPRNWLT